MLGIVLLILGTFILVNGGMLRVRFWNALVIDLGLLALYLAATMMLPIYRVAALTIDSNISSATALLYSQVDADVTVADVTTTGKATQTAHVKAGEVTRVTLVRASGTSHLVTITPAFDGVVSGSVLLSRAGVGKVKTKSKGKTTSAVAPGNVVSSVVPLTSVRGVVTVPPVAPDTSR